MRTIIKHSATAKKKKEKKIRYNIMFKLGEGGQAPVYQGLDVEKGETVALKLFRKFAMTDKEMEAVSREVNIIKELQHENIIGYKDYNENFCFKEHYFAVLVLELALGGDLLDYISVQHFEEPLARTYFSQLLSALDHCHSKLVYHLDLKPENLLLSSNGTLKLTDFGLSVKTDSQDKLLYSICGTQSYIAPEILVADALHGYKGAPADVFSASVVLFCMLSRNVPFGVAHESDPFFQPIKSGNPIQFWAYHYHASPHLQTFVLACNLLNRAFVHHPDDRISIARILEDEWMQGPTYNPSELMEAVFGRKELFTQIRTSVEADDRKQVKGAAATKRKAEQTRSPMIVPFKKPTYRSSETPSMRLYEEQGIMGLYKLYTSKSVLSDACILKRLEEYIRRIDDKASISTDSNDYTMYVSLLLPRPEVGESSELLPFPQMTLKLFLGVFQDKDDRDLLVITVKMKSGIFQDFEQCLEKLRVSLMGELPTESKSESQSQSESEAIGHIDKDQNEVEVSLEKLKISLMNKQSPKEANVTRDQNEAEDRDGNSSPQSSAYGSNLAIKKKDGCVTDGA